MKIDCLKMIIGGGGGSLENYRIIQSKFKFWNTTGEPQRFRTFVYEMIKHSNQFINLHPLEHATSLTASLSTFFGSDIHFVGRVEKFSEHWKILSQIDKCKDFVPYTNDMKIAHHMHLNGVHSPMPQRWTLDPLYVKWLSLDTLNVTESTKTQLPAYRAIDQDLFNAIVEHYWQDYVCFNYDYNYPSLNLTYTGRLSKD
ncbi:hypothetical protein RFI_11996 [Reticulomyxa filosa]|uniref:Uncharacterized protein n=1 Tax=Reticulomyxa filosa TaxID=46433 RepID=X6NGM3_RETFI|nr:hypothetical protein RFI_11996 [Reticulomyxa filosa]|eukprot:ETO25146.1 hypothetical protein RFI_11996 [Reticulomyxa filosa]